MAKGELLHDPINLGKAMVFRALFADRCSWNYGKIGFMHMKSENERVRDVSGSG